MRRRLTGLAVAISLMIALAFVVPLGFLVTDLAADRAISAGERRAQDLARMLATLGPERGLELASAEALSPEAASYPTSLLLAGGIVIGAPLLAGETTELALSGTAFRATADAGQIVYTPVIRDDGSTIVVRVLIPRAAITSGVSASLTLLAGVALFLVLLGATAAELIGRSVVEPVRDLAETASKLGQGDLSARLEPAGPEEIHDAGVEFNRLADRINDLLRREREAAADLSHRLRTPITALRLDVEGLADSEEKQRLWDDLDVLERTVSFLINEASRPADGGSTSDLASVLADRVAFWQPLAEEQGTTVAVDIKRKPAMVPIAEHDAEALIDILFDNFFTHVGQGRPIAVHLTVHADIVLLRFEDGGTGFSGTQVLRRGASGTASTGLGLHIVRSTAEKAGGSVVIGTSAELGGGRIEIRLPAVGH